MATIHPDEQFIKDNFEKVLSLIDSIMPYETELQKTRKDNLLKLFNDVGDVFATAPASYSTNYNSCFPGGLCYHTLHILKWVSRFANTMAPDKYPKDSILLVSLLHDIGKVGTLEEEYFIPAQDWQKKNGTMYNINPNIEFMRNNQRALWFCNYYNIPLTSDEYLAILLQEGQFDEANVMYRHRENDLAVILAFAVQWCNRVERQDTIKL